MGESVPWDGRSCRACKGTGEIVYARGDNRICLQCEDCAGTGRAGTAPAGPRFRTDGFRGPVYATGYQLGCWTCFGAGVVLTPNFAQRPCPDCVRD
ncbi:hypothetical protein ACFHW2_16080 [Actinomadura sp. LOL_016]|uniref:hypothetical protein n=1 Tax=unclassified Actinomadura TaxID=2626254 RepID=UPI0017485B0B